MGKPDPPPPEPHRAEPVLSQRPPAAHHNKKAFGFSGNPHFQPAEPCLSCSPWQTRERPKISSHQESPKTLTEQQGLT